MYLVVHEARVAILGNLELFFGNLVYLVQAFVVRGQLWGMVCVGPGRGRKQAPCGGMMGRSQSWG